MRSQIFVGKLQILAAMSKWFERQYLSKQPKLQESNSISEHFQVTLELFLQAKTLSKQPKQSLSLANHPRKPSKCLEVILKDNFTVEKALRNCPSYQT